MIPSIQGHPLLKAWLIWAQHYFPVRHRHLLGSGKRTDFAWIHPWFAFSTEMNRLPWKGFLPRKAAYLSHKQWKRQTMHLRPTVGRPIKPKHPESKTTRLHGLVEGSDPSSHGYYRCQSPFKTRLRRARTKQFMITESTSTREYKRTHAVQVHDAGENRFGLSVIPLKFGGLSRATVMSPIKVTERQVEGQHPQLLILIAPKNNTILGDTSPFFPGIRIFSDLFRKPSKTQV